MSIETEKRPLRAVNTPPEADVRSLDGRDEDMFPLRDATSAARILDCSPDHVHDLMATGRLPYVLLPPSKPGRSSAETEGRRRRVRADHLRQAVRDWAQD
jgi:hypothetical protein